MYDPKIARFLQEDTYRGDPNDPLSLNLYTYCDNNPIIYNDPTGHWKEGDDLIKDPYYRSIIAFATNMYNSGDATAKKTAETMADQARMEYAGIDLSYCAFYHKSTASIQYEQLYMKIYNTSGAYKKWLAEKKKMQSEGTITFFTNTILDPLNNTNKKLKIQWQEIEDVSKQLVNETDSKKRETLELFLADRWGKYEELRAGINGAGFTIKNNEIVQDATYYELLATDGANVKDAIGRFAFDVEGGYAGLGVRGFMLGSMLASIKVRAPQTNPLTNAAKTGVTKSISATVSKYGRGILNWFADAVVGKVYASEGSLNTVETINSQVVNRTNQLKNVIPDAQKGRVTMGVGIAKDASGKQVTLISTSEPNGYLRKGVTLNEGEILVKGGSTHAEVDIVNYCKENNLKLISVGATKPCSPGCVNAITPSGAQIATPIK